jgi:hypothetical protein
MKIKLNFEELFRQALSEYPEELDLSELQKNALDFSRYTVKGLYSIFEQAEELYIGSDVEIIMRNLHSSIYEVVLAAAKNITKIKSSSIRREIVKLIFENRLRNTAAATDLIWRPEDYALIESYFIENPSLAT